MAKKVKTKKAGAKKVAARPKPKPGAAGPPYKCETTDEPGVCLRFNLNPRTGQYNLPPGGIKMNCTDCEYFFD
jgi:hypothetical protein